MPLLSAIARHISQATGEPFAAGRQRAAAGGCINRALVLADGERRYFVKLNDESRQDMFAAEAEGLAELARARAVRVPQPVCQGTAAGAAYLVLEYLDLGAGDAGAEERLGRELAQMHRVTGARYGWHRDNTIGSTPQINTPSDDWAGFWRTHRLVFQLRLAAERGQRGRLLQLGERLAAALDALFTDYRPAPALLHGDLWGGNFGVQRSGRPVIFDPAVYYGDRETDIAMTELFGGYGLRFHAAYREAYPLDPGYAVRRTLYNLYHVLNHLNLFGGGYGAQAEHMMQALLSELR